MKKGLQDSPLAARPQKGRVPEEALTRYANVLLDSVFKKIFGSEQNKDMLVALIEQVLPGKKISSITYTNTVHTNDDPGKHDSVFDVECVDALTGERFDVEIQKNYQPHYYDRTLYYSSLMIARQLEKGVRFYDFPPVYVISLQDYVIHSPSEGFRFSYAIRNERTKELLTDKLNFVFLELPNARGLDTPGVSTLEKTCYALHNMTAFRNRPPELEGKFFEKLFELAEIAKFAPEERKQYEKTMLTERDKLDQLEWARMQGEEKGREEGKAEGKAEGKTEDARNLKALGVDIDTIAKATGLDKAVIEAL